MDRKLDIWPYLGKIFPVKLPNQVITIKICISPDQHFQQTIVLLESSHFSSSSFIYIKYSEYNSKEKMKAFEMFVI